MQTLETETSSSSRPPNSEAKLSCSSGGTVLLFRKSRILFTERLIRDLDRWRTLTPHKHIAPILGVALHISNLPALVVPAFRTVAQVLKQDPQTDVLSLMNGVAAGLGHLHAQTPPVAHGDLKGVRSCFVLPVFCCTTCTIFVSPTGTAILSDIGIASIPQPPEWDFKTGDDARWLAPEVLYLPLRPEVEGGEGFQASKTVTCESDVYAFAWRHTRSVMMAVIQGARPPRPSTEQSPQLTDRLWALIQECWAQKYQDRPKIEPPPFQDGDEPVPNENAMEIDGPVQPSAQLSNATLQIIG
ncbi:hypothetical protein B0H13DRAFT_2352816 [Mycena leptocephala]|nr:hypothetical protein B0H13DRAFT_2352816 [Mycena leptocephala]